MGSCFTASHFYFKELHIEIIFNKKQNIAEYTYGKTNQVSSYFGILQRRP